MEIPNEIFSEADVQAEFFHHCRLLGLACALEVNTPCGRLDAAIFSSDWARIKAIVECKNGARFSQAQINRYKMIGVPVFGLCSMAKAPRLAAQLNRDTMQWNGVPWTDVCAMQRAPRGGRKRAFGQTFNPKFDLEEEIIYRD